MRRKDKRGKGMVRYMKKSRTIQMQMLTTNWKKGKGRKKKKRRSRTRERIGLKRRIPRTRKECGRNTNRTSSGTKETTPIGAAATSKPSRTTRPSADRSSSGNHFTGTRTDLSSRNTPAKAKTESTFRKARLGS